LLTLEEFKDARLVGGTALALHLGHRKSIDLDFFGNISSSLEDLTHEISKFADAAPLSSSKFIRILIVNGIKVDVVNYPYKWIEGPIIENGIVLAGIKDIAAMKLSAITNRGTKKDFIDYFFLLKLYPLKQLIDLYLEKYSDAQLFTSIKSLTYFDDAEKDPMPDMTQPLDWRKVKSTIRKAVEDYLNDNR